MPSTRSNYAHFTPTPEDPPPGALTPKAGGVAGQLEPLRAQPQIWFKVRVYERDSYEAVKNAADSFVSNVTNGKYKDVPADAYEPAMAITEPDAENPSAKYTATVWLRYVM